MSGHVHLKIGIRCLACVGFWPLKLNNKYLNILYKLYFALTMSIYVAFVSTQFVEMYFLRNENLEEISFLLGVIFLYVLGLVKIWVIGSADVKKLLQKVKTTEEHILSNNDEIAVKIYKMYVGQNYAVNIIVLGIVVLCVAMFFITPIVTELLNPPTIFYDIINNTRVYRARPLPLSSWFPFDRYKYYKTSYVWHSLALATIPTYLISCDNLFWGFIIFAVGQLKILQKHLRKVSEIGSGCSEEFDKVVVADRLRKCAEYHKAIITFVDELDQAMRTFLLLDFVAHGLQMAVIGFQAAVAQLSFHLFTTTIYLLTMSVQLFVFYWFGNEIRIESEGVARAIWESKWFLCNSSAKKSFLILMVRSQKPLTLSVGPFYDVSIATMMLVLRTGYSYAAIMRRLYSH